PVEVTAGSSSSNIRFSTKFTVAGKARVFRAEDRAFPSVDGRLKGRRVQHGRKPLGAYQTCLDQVRWRGGRRLVHAAIRRPSVRSINQRATGRNARSSAEVS